MDNYPLLKKGLVVGIILLFVGTGIIPSSAQDIEKPSFPTSTGKTIYVDDDNILGPWDGTLQHPYQQIQDAANVLKRGDTIYVYNGTYHVNVLRINHTSSIKLLGEDKNTTIIIGKIWFEHAHGLTISGFTWKTLTLSQPDCLTLGHSTNCTISGNIFEPVNFGMELAYLFNCNVSSNTFELYGLTNPLAIAIGLSTQVIMNDNKFLGDPSSDPLLGQGIQMGVAPRNTISRNLFMNLESAIQMGSGIPLTRHNLISNNTIINTPVGIAVGSFSAHNIIKGNIINTSWDGIVLYDQATRNLIYQNKISHCLEGGIIGYWAYANDILANTISDNKIGIMLGGPGGELRCFFNRIAFNNIVRSEYWNVIDFNGINLWYNLKSGKGNYWDNYTGIDANGDGVGDTPYNIPGCRNKDRYPLMEPVDINNVTGIGDVFHEYADDGNDDMATYSMLLSFGSLGVFNSLYQHHQYSETNRNSDLLNKINYFFLGIEKLWKGESNESLKICF